MLGGISHDVRTFLTRLRLRVERIPDTEERDRAIADIADMLRLLDDALLASRAGAGELAEELVDFGQVVRAEVEDCGAAGQLVDVRTVGSAGADATVLGDRLALRRVVANLVGNALIYGKAAHLSIDTDREFVTLIVDDHGPGIPPDQREAILEPFVRLEDSRNRHTGGAGLGLAVARSLLEAHGGTISIADATSGGARVTVRLPLFVAR
jgi:signal transduction histidine kinase